MQVAETWRQRCHQFENSRATRKPIALTLGKKLHDEIGYSLRKYQRLSGCRHDSVQMLTRCFLESLQLEIGCLEGASGDWLAKQDGVTCPVPHLILSEPPGLERRAEPSGDIDDDIEVLGSNACLSIRVNSRAEVTRPHTPKTSRGFCTGPESMQHPTATDKGLFHGPLGSNF